MSNTRGTTTSNSTRDNGNVVDLFSGKTFPTLQKERLVRLSPEHDGICMLYSTTKSNPDKLYTMRILCWGIRDNGEVVGLVPWLNQILPCDELEDPFFGQFEGYYDIGSERVFYHPPPHKTIELETAASYFRAGKLPEETIIQEIPDTIGTHAMLNADDDSSLILTEVLSWRLQHNGHIQAMLVDEDKVNVTPVLPGDPCLYPAEDNPNFRYFFQHQIANQIKSQDPEALAAIALLFD